jgi:hypothetical protein
MKQGALTCIHISVIFVHMNIWKHKKQEQKQKQKKAKAHKRIELHLLIM